jgi:hypothetical protein
MLTYSLLYLSIAALHPNIFDFIASRLPILNGILGLVFLISFFWGVAIIIGKLTGRRSKIDDFRPPHHDDEEKIETDQIRQLKRIRGKLRTVQDIQDRLTAIEATIKKNPVLNKEVSDYLKLNLEEISNQERILMKSYNDVTLQFSKLGRIDSERLQRLEDNLKRAPDNQRRFIEAELDIERRKIQHDKAIIDFKQKLDSLIGQFNLQLNAAMQQLKNHEGSGQPSIQETKKTLQEISMVIEAIKQLERELIQLHKAQRKLFRSKRQGK